MVGQRLDPLELVLALAATILIGRHRGTPRERPDARAGSPSPRVATALRVQPSQADRHSSMVSGLNDLGLLSEGLGWKSRQIPEMNYRGVETGAGGRIDGAILKLGMWKQQKRRAL
jgi:hypothetical protein